LTEDLVGDVDRILGHEVDTDTLRPNEPHDLFDLLEQRGWRVGEEQVRFVEEEDELWLVGIADLRQLLEQLREQPQQKRRVEARVVYQLVGGEDVHHTSTIDRLHQVVDVEHRLAEKLLPALFLDLQEAALNRADARRGDVAVLRLELRRVVADELEHRPQILEVEQQQTVVVGDLEHHRQHAFLSLVETEQARD